MNNVKSVMNYFDGNFLFNLYLKNIIGNTNDESYMYEDNLLNDINKNAVIMGCICNIMTSIKDGLNDKTNNFNKYFSEIVNKELSDNILMIASKNKDGYAIDDYTFKNVSSILATLRNKLSYGNFVLDLEQGNVTFKVNNNDVSIDIDTLANYVISSLWTYMRIDDSNKYMRNIVVTNKFDNILDCFVLVCVLKMQFFVIFWICVYHDRFAVFRQILIYFLCDKWNKWMQCF